jgi:hypothetical protein
MLRLPLRPGYRSLPLRHPRLLKLVRSIPACDAIGWQIVLANDAEQALIGPMRAMRADGMSFARIANQLNADKVPTKRGGTWASMTIKKILDRAA